MRALLSQASFETSSEYRGSFSVCIHSARRSSGRASTPTSSGAEEAAVEFLVLPQKADDYYGPNQSMVAALKAKNIASSIVGDVVEKPGVIIIDKTFEKMLEHPRVDPFWAAFEREMGTK